MRFSLTKSHHKPHLRSTAEIIRDNLLSPFHGLMLCCAIVLIACGAERHQLVFLFFVVLNVVLRIFYDLSARNAVRRLERPDPPRTVLRNGQIVHAQRASDLMEGDVLSLHKGDLAPTDCVLLAGEPMVADALVTGSSHASRRSVGEKIYGESNILFSSCCVRVLYPAQKSLAAYLVDIAPPNHARRAEIDIGKQRLVLILGSVAMLLAVWKAVALLSHGDPVRDALIYAATMVTSLVPVMWLLLSSVSLYLGAHTLRKKNAAARDLYCVELLARADVVCFDKTGTITLRAPEGRLREDIDALEFFHREGVTLKILSGDTVESVAAVLGRTTHGGRVFDCREAYNNDALLESAVQTHTGFAEATARQKAVIVRTLRHAGHTVAMVGDGANDVAALRAADCSICFGSGADEVRAASNIVLLDNHLSALPDIVLEGRRVINNITRTASLFLVKTVMSFLVTLCAVAFPMTYPFEPLQLTLIGMFAESIPGFFLTLEPNDERVKGRFLQTVLVNAVPSGVMIALSVALIQLLVAPFFSLSAVQSSTLCVYVTGFIWLVQLYRLCRPLTAMRRWLCILMTVGFFAGVLLLSVLMPAVFALPTVSMLLIFAVFAAGILPLDALLDRLTRCIRK